MSAPRETAATDSPSASPFPSATTTTTTTTTGPSTPSSPPTADGRSWFSRLGRVRRSNGDGTLSSGRHTNSTGSPNGSWALLSGFRLAEELENKGSVARDHLASERTFLAWLRTSLGFVSLGIAVAQLFKIPDIVTRSASSSPSEPALVEALELEVALALGVGGDGVGRETREEIVSLAAKRLGLDGGNLAFLLAPSPASSAYLDSPTLIHEEGRTKILAALLSLAKADLETSKADSWGRLQTMQKIGKPLGATCILLGAICLLLGARRYFIVQSHLVKGTYVPSRVEVSAISLILGALICAAFGVIVGTKVGGGA